MRHKKGFKTRVDKEECNLKKTVHTVLQMPSADIKPWLTLENFNKPPLDSKIGSTVIFQVYLLYSHLQKAIAGRESENDLKQVCLI